MFHQPRSITAGTRKNISSISLIIIIGMVFLVPSLTTTTTTATLSSINDEDRHHHNHHHHRQLARLDPRTVESKVTSCDHRTKHEKIDPTTDSVSHYDDYEQLGDDLSVDMAVNLCEEPIFDIIIDYAIQLKVKKLYVYSKCGQVFESKFYTREDNDIARQVYVDFATLINRGREGHTWIHHMLRQDIHFAKWTIFIQATDLNRDRMEPHTPLNRIVLASLIAHEHDEQSGDGTNFIDLSRLWGSNSLTNNGLICAPRTKEIRSEFLVLKPQRWFYDRFKSPGANSYDDATHMTLYGEFLVRDDLIHNLNRTKFEYIQSVLETKNAPRWGHYVEKTWIGLLGAKDSCRCYVYNWI